ncbi:MAG: AraC family transcriptional regulator [Spirochaetes bacterium]|nr:AraC family transcriptional regulator [Spirochaetota bacterium]
MSSVKGNTIGNEHVRVSAYIPLRIERLSFTGKKNVAAHAHTFYEIGITLRGSAVHRTNGVREVIRPGSVYVIAPGETHDIDSAGRWDVCNIYYLPELFTDDMRSLFALPRVTGMFFHHFLFNRADPLCFRLPADHQRTVRSLLAVIEHAPRDIYAESFVKHAFLALMLALASAHKQVLPDFEEITADRRLFNSLDAVEKNCTAASGVIVRAVNSALGFTPAYASAYFHEKTGTTLSDYLLRRKIMRSCPALLEGVPVTETAHMFGFFDASHFIRVFKSVMHTTPHAYCSTVKRFRADDIGGN